MVRAADLERLVDVKGKLSEHRLSTDREAVDVCAAPRLALPGRRHAPVRLAFFGILFDAVDQVEQVVDVDTVDDPGFDLLCFGNHD
jgi:hypothetical protein